MSEADEPMDGSGEDSEQKQSPEKQSSSPDKSYMWGAGEIIEGKRAKKTVERLDMQVPKKAVKLSFGEGSGEKLGDIPRVGLQLNKMKPDNLVPLHSLLFDRRGKASMIKKNIRLFNGFTFDAESEQFNKKRDKLTKNTKSKLMVMCGVLDLEKKGSHADLVDKIMAFLMEPKSSGKRLPKKKKRSKKNLSGDDGKPKKKPSKKRSSSGKQKPSSTSSPKKSKAIVMDSSSDDEDDDGEEEEKAGSEESEAESEAESGGASAEEPQSEEPSEEEEEEEESPKPKARGKTKKTPPAKKQKTPSKKPAKKRSRKEVSSESESSAEEEPKTKKSKPAAKTKKADSSSNSKNNNTTMEESSDEDEPLSKMVRKTPSDEQLKETVQTLLKEANLEELTMKQICQKVFDAYSEHDLSSKKDFIKQTVKSLIT